MYQDIFTELDKCNVNYEVLDLTGVYSIYISVEDNDDTALCWVSILLESDGIHVHDCMDGDHWFIYGYDVYIDWYGEDI